MLGGTMLASEADLGPSGIQTTFTDSTTAQFHFYIATDVRGGRALLIK